MREDIQGLQQPGATSLGDTYDGTLIFFLIPTAQRAVIECQSTCPLDIILAVREAITELIDSLDTSDASLIDELEIHLTSLVYFCFLLGGLQQVGRRRIFIQI